MIGALSRGYGAFPPGAGAALRLQSHHHRAEHWIVVQGTAKVTVDGEDRRVTENQAVFIPLGAVHRMENSGKLPMVLIEVQTGGYLGEDDIIRYDDVYARGQGARGRARQMVADRSRPAVARHKAPAVHIRSRGVDGR